MPAAKREVTMTVSYGGGLVAGETYKLGQEEADTLILKGYATGDLSRDYSDAEREVARASSQVVSVGG